MSISVTLNFPDQSALVAFFSGKAALLATEAATVTEAVETAAPPAKPKAEKAAAPAASAAPAPTTAPVPAAAAKQPGVDYPTLQKAVFKLAGIRREAASEVVATFGVKTFKDLDADRWADALKAVEAKIEDEAAMA